MKKRYLFLSILLIGIILNTKIGYAVSLGSDNLPNDDFTTNATSSSTKLNLVGDALSSTSYSTAFKNNFTVVKDLKDSGGTYPLYILSKNSLVPRTSETFEYGNEHNNPTTVSDTGLKYILRYGYNRNNTGYTIFDRADLKTEYGTVTSNSTKQYITQIAIWMYINEKSSLFPEFCSNSRCSFTESSNLTAAIQTATTKNSQLKYITKLVEEAKNPPATTTNPCGVTSKITTYTFKNNREYILTGSLKLKDIDEQRFIRWDAQVVDPNEYGIYITDASGKKLVSTTNLAKNAEIRLHIPLKEDLTSMDLTESGIKIKYYYMDESVSAQEFRVTKTTDTDILTGSGGTKTERFSNVLLGAVKQKNGTKSYTLKNFTDFRKTDVNTKEELAGAHLVVYNATDIDEETKLPKENVEPFMLDGKKLEWDTEKGISRKLYMPNGKYGLCETVAPENYQKSEKCIIFEVKDADSITVVAMDNEPIPIPDTAIFKQNLPYVIGGILLLIGSMGVFIVINKNKKES